MCIVTTIREDRCKREYNQVLLKAVQENQTEAALALERAGASFAEATAILEEEKAQATQRQEENRIRALPLLEMKVYHRHEAGLFGHTRRLFEDKSPRSVVRGLREEAEKDPRGASAKTIGKFGV